MLVLGIESSCDETGIALYDSNEGLIAATLYSQIATHAGYGGVVPELASRDHVRKTLPLIRETLKTGGRAISDLDAVAYTSGPGLIGALMVGAAIGRALAWSRGIPALGVHHMEAHLLAPLIGLAEDDNVLEERLPFVALLVSGGHTQLVQVDRVGSYELLGESVDDAAGEAFDKVSKMLGLGYPGGPAIARKAADGRGDRFLFPRPMTDRPGLDFSFSGLKTFARNTIHSIENLTEQDKADVAKAFEEAVVDTLVTKCHRALEATGIKHLVIAGGVAANRELRARLTESIPSVFYAPPDLCTDNGAMIAYAGYRRLAAGAREPLAISTRARWPLTDLPNI